VFATQFGGAIFNYEFEDTGHASGYLSMTLDGTPSNFPAIAYFDSATSTVRVARKTGASTWCIQRAGVKTNGGIPGTSITMRPDGNRGLAYGDSLNFGTDAGPGPLTPTFTPTPGTANYIGNRVPFTANMGVVLDATSKNASVRFTAKSSSPNTDVRIYFSAVVGSPGYRVNFQGDAGGIPNGVSLGTSAP